MKSALILATTILMTLPASSAIAADVTPPDAEKRPHVVKAPHGAERNDEYYWLRDDEREDKAMLAYLEAENAYADQVMAPLRPLEDALYGEIVGRIKQDDSSIPARERGWWYYARYETGKDYPIHARRKDGPGVDALSIQQANERGEFAGEQVLLDVNVLAEGKDYYAVGAYEVSQDNNVLAWADDTNGRRQYTFRFRDLATGKAYPEELRGTSGDLVFADDNRTVFYVENDPETLLTKRVKRHVIGTDPRDDVVVYERPDRAAWGYGVSVTSDGDYLVVTAREGSDPRNHVFVRDLRTPGSPVAPLREADAAYTFLGSEGRTFWFYTDRDAPLGREVPGASGVAGEIDTVVERVNGVIPAGGAVLL